MDRLDVTQRSACMARIRGKDTAPEMLVRRVIYALGYRYRLHRRDLPGTPDIVLIGRRKAIFVHGCFWHGHTCRRGRPPASNVTFWRKKLAGNRERDERHETALRKKEWSVLTIWECEIKDRARLQTVITEFLEAPRVVTKGL